MTPTEIWLRLMRVNNLYGDKMVLVARRLAGAGHADNETLHEAGLTKAQAIQFLAFKQQEIDASLQWLEQPEERGPDNVTAREATTAEDTFIRFRTDMLKAILVTT